MKINGKRIIVYLIFYLVLSGYALASNEKISKSSIKKAKKLNTNANSQTKTKTKNPLRGLGHNLKAKIYKYYNITKDQIIKNKEKFNYIKGIFYFILNIVSKMDLSDYPILQKAINSINYALRLGGIAQACYTGFKNYYDRFFGEAGNNENTMPNSVFYQPSGPIDFLMVEKYFSNEKLVDMNSVKVDLTGNTETKSCEVLNGLKDNAMQQWDTSNDFKKNGKDMITNQIMKKFLKDIIHPKLTKGPMKTDKHGQQKQTYKYEKKVVYSEEQIIQEYCGNKSQNHQIYRTICTSVLQTKLFQFTYLQLRMQCRFNYMLHLRNQLYGDGYSCPDSLRLKKFRTNRQRKYRKVIFLPFVAAGYGIAYTASAAYNYMTSPEDPETAEKRKMQKTLDNINNSMKDKKNLNDFYKTFNLSVIGARHEAMVRFLENGCVKSILSEEKQAKSEQEAEESKNHMKSWFKKIQDLVLSIFNEVANFASLINTCIAPTYNIYKEYKDQIQQEILEKERIEKEAKIDELDRELAVNPINEAKIKSLCKDLGISEKDLEVEVTNASLNQMYNDPNNNPDAVKDALGPLTEGEDFINNDTTTAVGDNIDEPKLNGSNLNDVYENFVGPDDPQLGNLASYSLADAKKDISQKLMQAKKKGEEAVERKKKEINDECAKGSYECAKMITKKSVELGVNAALTAKKLTPAGMAMAVGQEGVKMAFREIILKDVVFEATDKKMAQITKVEESDGKFRQIAKGMIQKLYVVGKIVVANDIKKPNIASGKKMISNLKTLGIKYGKELNNMKKAIMAGVKKNNFKHQSKEILKGVQARVSKTAKNYYTGATKNRVISDLKIVYLNAKIAGKDLMKFSKMSRDEMIHTLNMNSGKMIIDTLDEFKKMVRNTRNTAYEMMALFNNGAATSQQIKGFHESVNKAYASIKSVMSIIDNIHGAVNLDPMTIPEVTKNIVKKKLLKFTQEKFKKQVDSIESFIKEMYKNYSSQDRSIKTIQTHIAEVEAEFQSANAEIVKQIKINNDVPEPAPNTELTEAQLPKYKLMLTSVMKEKLKADAQYILNHTYYEAAHSTFTTAVGTVSDYWKSISPVIGKADEILRAITTVFGTNLKKQFCESVVKALTGTLLLDIMKFAFSWRKVFEIGKLVTDFYHAEGTVDKFSIAGDLIGEIIQFFLGGANPSTDVICSNLKKRKEESKRRRKQRIMRLLNKRK